MGELLLIEVQPEQRLDAAIRQFRGDLKVRVIVDSFGPDAVEFQRLAKRRVAADGDVL